jgi:hypothetical protein
MTKRRGRGHGTKRKNKRTMRRRHSHSAHLTRNRSRRHRHRHGSRVRRGGMFAAAAGVEKEYKFAKGMKKLYDLYEKKNQYDRRLQEMSSRPPGGIAKPVVPTFSYPAASAASGRQLPSGAVGVSKAPAPYSRKPISVTNLVTPPSLTVPPSNRHFAAARAASASDAAPSARADAGMNE